MYILIWLEDFDGKIPAPAILKRRAPWTTGRTVIESFENRVNQVQEFDIFFLIQNLI